MSKFNVTLPHIFSQNYACYEVEFNYEIVDKVIMKDQLVLDYLLAEVLHVLSAVGLIELALPFHGLESGQVV